MGTNYYAVKRKPCLYNREVHIGKCSYGYLFLFHENELFHTYGGFIDWLYRNIETEEYVLLNEYEEEISATELIKIIDDKQKDKRCLDNPNNFNNCKNVDGYRFSDKDFI